ncbi:hypothetical protein [Vibrio vulnificus YJ016]|uniref:Uncharacterized protein n=1 Tax=Vibrio vulnificus (strain YJ016) TaxID=196600 RepID=Q7MFY5_VIBVY|nr:hypothetical protein [Vibrio vulnificus YJ016]
MLVVTTDQQHGFSWFSLRFRVEHHLISFITIRPEVDVELRIVAHLDTMPILWRTGRKLPRGDHHHLLCFRSLFVGKTIVRDRPFHHAQLAKDPLRGIVVCQQRCWHGLFGKKWGGALNRPLFWNAHM